MRGSPGTPGPGTDAPLGAEGRRLPWIDAARGIAIVAMAIYHFAWDLEFFGFIAADVDRELGWRLFARAIAGSFLFLVGVGLALAARKGINWRRYLRRLAMITAAALAITVATWFTFPDSFIFFGILHNIALSSVLALPLLRLPVLAVTAAAVFCLAAPHFLVSPVFDHPALWWLGLMTFAPRSNDFVPIFPWFGVVLAGITVTRIVLARPPKLPPVRLPAPLIRPLAWAGRHSLPIYLVHQPVLIGLVYLAATIAPPARPDAQQSFIESCSGYCMQGGLSEQACRPTCGCLATESQAAGIWPNVLADTLDAGQTEIYRALALQCRAEVTGE